jgi:hypothetical protein
MCYWLSACSPVSYLEHHRPTDLVFQKKVYGGVTALVGTELHAPSFSLYADGTVIYYQYIEGKRKLVSSRLSKTDFLAMYDWIHKNLSNDVGNTPKQSGALVTEFFFNSHTVIIEGLGFIRGSISLDTLQEFSKQIDQLVFKNSKKYISKKIVLYVKRLSGGESRSWPEWKILEVNLDSVYKKEISFYEPNVTENSILLEGKLAEKIQKIVEQTSLYQKFSFDGKIYAVGYKPVLP